MPKQRTTPRSSPPRRESASRRAAVATLAINVTGTDRATRRLLTVAARAALAAEHVRDGGLDITVVGADTMCEQHAQWMNDPTVTDVLTFDLRDPPTGPIDGQIIVCADVARDRAARRDADWRGELVLYVVHGCLHLCGYDDRTAADFRRMHAREDEIMTTLGFGPIFRDGESSNARSKPHSTGPNHRPLKQSSSTRFASNRPTQSRAGQRTPRRTPPRAIRRNASRSG